MNIGRPKDLEKRKKILEAAKALFLERGYHGSSMNHIAKEAGVTKLTVYNHFQDKDHLFTCAIAETCEESINAQPMNLTPQSNFDAVLHQVCLLTLKIVQLPEAIKLEHLLVELSAEQNSLATTFYNASHQRLFSLWVDFFQQAIHLKFIKDDQPEKQAILILSLLLGQRYHEILLGVRELPSDTENKTIITEAIELFLLKYQLR